MCGDGGGGGGGGGVGGREVGGGRVEGDALTPLLLSHEGYTDDNLKV